MKIDQKGSEEDNRQPRQTHAALLHTWRLGFTTEKDEERNHI